MKFFDKQSVTRLIKLSLKNIFAVFGVFLLSTLLGIGLIVLTVVPTDIRLIQILLTDITLMSLNILPLFLVLR